MVIDEALSRFDLFVAAGTSGNIHPAARFVAVANSHGGHSVEINLEPPVVKSGFAQIIRGRASAALPEFLCQFYEDKSC